MAQRARRIRTGALGEPTHGFLPLCKPVGPTSRAVVDAVQRLVPGTRVGHAGTLDPSAGGLLMVCLGAYTRLGSLCALTDREYEGVILFGRSTDTWDLEGRTVARAQVPEDLMARVEQVLPRFVGSYPQEVPPFSAAKWEGKPRYAWARRRVQIPVKTKVVHVKEIRTWPHPRSKRRLGFRIVCGSGFYVRTWARDLGEAVGVPATLARLWRTRIGPFVAERALRLQDLSPATLAGAVVRGPEAIPWLPRVAVDSGMGARLARGTACPWPQDPGGELVAVTDEASRLMLVARWRDGMLWPHVVLPEGARW